MSEDRLAEIKALWGVWADNAAETDGTSREQRLREITLLADDMRWLFTEVERLRAEVARLEAKSKALRAECSDLWEVIERAKDALPRYDGLYVADVAETLEILQGALDEEPDNAC